MMIRCGSNSTFTSLRIVILGNLCSKGLETVNHSLLKAAELLIRH